MIFVDASGDGRYRRVVLVGLGWHGAVVAPFLINTWRPLEDTSCADAASFCFTARDGAQLLLILVGVFLGGSALLTLLVAWPLSRRIPSGFLAGTLAAVAGAVVAATLIAVFGGFVYLQNRYG
ncbi:hypothetical protein [Actinoplanes awajinensis]|uniref:hypothetical protein n=1 Tax=Actinoplanes awajinensis TaxID=135946 RepID=UPI000A942AFD|nr:hypothetical protein [Actinoplanes awajinensis]